MDDPVFFIFLGAAKHLHGNAFIFRQTHADMAPNIADFPLEDFTGYTQFFFNHSNALNGGLPVVIFH
jgi:hypothetical protein